MVKVYSLSGIDFNMNGGPSPWVLIRRSPAKTVANMFTSRYKKWKYRVNPNSKRSYFKFRGSYKEICQSKL